MTEEQATPAMATFTAGHGLELGDWVYMGDQRKWYVKLWHWIIRKPPPSKFWTIVSMESSATVLLEERKL